VGIVAHPLAGLARTLNGLLGGLAVALSQLREQREQGVAGEAAPSADRPAAQEPSPDPEVENQPEDQKE